MGRLYAKLEADNTLGRLLLPLLADLLTSSSRGSRGSRGTIGGAAGGWAMGRDLSLVPHLGKGDG